APQAERSCRGGAGEKCQGPKDSPGRAGRQMSLKAQPQAELCESGSRTGARQNCQTGPEPALQPLRTGNVERILRLDTENSRQIVVLTARNVGNAQRLLRRREFEQAGLADVDASRLLLVANVQPSAIKSRRGPADLTGQHTGAGQFFVPPGAGAGHDQF